MRYNNVEINWLGHAGFQIDKKIYIDPFQIDVEDKADLILITHSHYDHCSLEDLKKIIKSDTIVIGPPDVQSKIAKISHDIKFQIVQPFQRLKIKDIVIETFPAYNINKPFHPKSNGWLGYILHVDGVKICHVGDSDATPELKQLKNIDMLMLPVDGNYTMNSEEAANVANIVMPKVAIPMHFGSIVGDMNDAKRFKDLCKCRVEILDKV
jgi:L-ascorbate metabolism protein UlaG (beta-lactamase superfamily)